MKNNVCKILKSASSLGRKKCTPVTIWRCQHLFLESQNERKSTDFESTRSFYIFSKVVKSKPSDSMLVAQAAERNKQPILDVLQKYAPPEGTPGLVFEVASGTGQHVTHFAAHFPHIRWQPTDLDPKCLNSIRAHIEDKGLKNVLPPLEVDASKPLAEWATADLTPGSCDLVLNINMVHISPWESSVGLFKTASSLLKPGGYLFMYGPYKVEGVLTPASNVQFDEYLRSQDNRWGIRDVVDLDALAAENGLKRINMVDMPANNKCTTFKKEA